MYGILEKFYQKCENKEGNFSGKRSDDSIFQQLESVIYIQFCKIFVSRAISKEMLHSLPIIFTTMVIQLSRIAPRPILLLVQALVIPAMQGKKNEEKKGRIKGVYIFYSKDIIIHTFHMLIGTFVLHTYYGKNKNNLIWIMIREY